MQKAYWGPMNHMWQVIYYIKVSDFNPWFEWL